MIITCPGCQKKYKINNDLIKEIGRQVQCVSCSYLWYYQSAQKLPKTNYTASPSIVMTKNKKGIKSKIIIPLCILITIIVGSMYILRSTILDYYPEAKKIYKIFNIKELDNSKLSLEDLTYSIIKENNGSRIILKGNIVNNTDEVININYLHITVNGSCENANLFNYLLSKVIGPKENICKLGDWKYYPSAKILNPNEKITFESTSLQTFKSMQSLNVQIVS